MPPLTTGEDRIAPLERNCHLSLWNSGTPGPEKTPVWAAFERNISSWQCAAFEKQQDARMAARAHKRLDAGIEESSVAGIDAHEFGWFCKPGYKSQKYEARDARYRASTRQVSPARRSFARSPGPRLARTSLSCWWTTSS